MDKCPVCNGDATTKHLEDVVAYKVTCARCGDFRIDGLAKRTLPQALAGDERKIANVSGWIREHQNELIDQGAVESLLKLSTPNYGERKYKLLRWLERNSKHLGQCFNVLEKDIVNTLLSATYSENAEEFNFLKEAAYIEELIDYAGDCGGRPGSSNTASVSSKGDSAKISLSAKGYDFLSQFNKNLDSQIGFCAMWFDDSVKNIWSDAISPAILDAGYEPKRIDEHPHNNRIDDEIIALIRRSRFVVADFTGQRGGVYFEAGYALGMNLPVIWTVKKSELASVHFDNRQYNFITWEENNLPEFKLNLQYRIEATLGRGKYQPS